MEQFGIDAIKQVLFFPQQLILRFSTETRLDTPYTDQYNLGAEWGVGRHGAFQTNVTRALGYHQALLRDLNPVIGTDVQEIPIHRDPTVGSIAAFVTEGRSWYSGLRSIWDPIPSKEGSPCPPIRMTFRVRRPAPTPIDGIASSSRGSRVFPGWG